jgi:hypothetical protein
MSKYETLVRILDELRKEAPPNFGRYYPLDSEIEKLNQARTRAFIHLFLKVKFGMLDFVERERLLTEGSKDGGVDAYYIDREGKKIYFIQSKFRTKEDNFTEKEIELGELLRIDVDRITDGQEANEDGEEYCGKIKQLLREMNKVPDIGRYDYPVIILANLRNISAGRLKKLTGGFSATVFDYDRSYKELVFPVVTGTYYSPSELIIPISISNKSSASARISYKVKTDYKDCEITVLFVPTIEIAKTLYKYKNSILRYNPRNYLELANNTVNREIAKTIEERTNNEFALLNNGITVLSYGTSFSEKIGKKGEAQLILTQPQIINGGQTAFTLSRLYESNITNDHAKELFKGKEVLLKVITLNPGDIKNGDGEHRKFVEAISKATNQQTPVDDADRRSNDSIQIEMQNRIFNDYGYFYERKRGEYADGIKSGYINRSQIIDRELFLRLCKACDFAPAESRSASGKELFKEDNFTKTLNNVNRYKEYFFAFKCYEELVKEERKFSKDKFNKFGFMNYGNALRYGKFAAVSVCRSKYEGDQSLVEVGNIVKDTLMKWPKFESHISSLQSNKNYFKTYVDSQGFQKEEYNFDGYYKGGTIGKDVLKFFKVRES